jgi:CPA1 family monovalent cation:H+ antiporter
VSRTVPFSWQHVIYWGGLHGSISLALALSLPAALGSDRELLRVMAFGVVLFNLLVQATTMQPLIKRLKIVSRSPAQIEYELRHARLVSWKAGESHLDRRHREGLVSTHTWEKLKERLGGQTESLTEDVRDVLRTEPDLETEELDTNWREFIRARRSALVELRRDGIISDDVFALLTSEVDTALDDTWKSGVDDNEETTLDGVEIES